MLAGLKMNYKQPAELFKLVIGKVAQMNSVDMLLERTDTAGYLTHSRLSLAYCNKLCDEGLVR